MTRTQHLHVLGAQNCHSFSSLFLICTVNFHSSFAEYHSGDSDEAISGLFLVFLQLQVHQDKTPEKL